LNSIFYTHWFKIADPPFFQARIEALSRKVGKPLCLLEIAVTQLVNHQNCYKTVKKKHNPEPKPSRIPA
jgi:hypothetical protein